MIERLSTVERARGRWRQILPLLGIATEFLPDKPKKHGPCPLCGGKDRYRFDDKDGSGSYYCHQCGAGVGLILVRKKNRWDHKTACNRIDEILGDATSDPAPQIKPADDSKRRLGIIERTLAGATDPSVIDRYLAKRGISRSSPVLRGHRALAYFDDGGTVVGYFPTVLAPIIGADGSLQSAVRIYDADVKPRKKNLPPVTTIAGGAIRLFEPREGELGIAEGVETALAAAQLFSLPVWSVLNDTGINAFTPPTGIRSVTIFADNDLNYVGEAAAYATAKRLTRAGLNVIVHMPPDPDTDWCDVLNGAVIA